jgi:hypothetical protein
LCLILKDGDVAAFKGTIRKLYFFIVLNNLFPKLVQSGQHYHSVWLFTKIPVTRIDT